MSIIRVVNYFFPNTRGLPPVCWGFIFGVKAYLALSFFGNANSAEDKS